MAFIYQVRFDIKPIQMNELEVGASLERVLSYLRALLPSEPGYVASRAIYSLDIADKTELIFQSVWETWDDLESHRKSSLAEAKVLTEFQPHISLEDLSVHIYEEVD